MKRLYIAFLTSILGGIVSHFPSVLPDFLVADFVAISLRWIALGFIIPFLFRRVKRMYKFLLLAQLALLPLMILLFSQNPENVLLTGVFALLPGLFFRFKDERPLAMDRRVHFTWQHHVQMSR